MALKTHTTKTPIILAKEGIIFRKRDFCRAYRAVAESLGYVFEE